MAQLPPNTKSAHLNARQLYALNRFGELMLPAHGEFPGFAELGCVQHIDLLVEHANKDDIALLKLFFSILYFKPRFAYRVVLWCMKNAEKFPAPLSPIFRTMDMGLRGLVVSLYYSGLKSDSYHGKTPLEIIGFDVNIIR